MTDLFNTEAMGDCVQNWDAFYKSNYAWLYATTLDIAQNTIIAKQMADKILAHLVLSHPDIIVENNVEECQRYVALLFPYLGQSVDRKKELSAGRLLNVYYNPN